MKKKTRYIILSTASVLLFFAIWELITDGLRLFPKAILPSPVKVLSSFVQKLYSPNPDGFTLPQHIFASLRITLAGYIVGATVGTALGIAMAWFKKFDYLARPIFDLVRPIPPIAWIPLAIMWLGIGIFANAFIIFLGAFVACVVNSYAGIQSTNMVHIWVAETFGATRLQILRRVAIPSALPQIFTGLRVALSMSWMALVASEMLGSSRGVGFMMSFARNFARTDLIIVGMLTIGGFGALLAFILAKIEAKYIKGA